MFPTINLPIAIVIFSFLESEHWRGATNDAIVAVAHDFDDSLGCLLLTAQMSVQTCCLATRHRQLVAAQITSNFLAGQFCKSFPNVGFIRALSHSALQNAAYA